MTKFSKTWTVFASVLAAIIVAFMVWFGVSIYVDNNARCTVTHLTEFHFSNTRSAYRVHTEECGTFSVSGVPLRGISSDDAVIMFRHINLGETYHITYIHEGFGVLTDRPSIIDIKPSE